MDKEAMKQEVTRFFMVEHFTGMLLAIILITVGYVIGKRALPEKSAKIIFWFYTIALLLILAFIPWPFRGLGGGWI
jgi:membrane protein DedA with SNARE-associated domain